MDFYRFRLPGFERPYTRQVRNKGLIVNPFLERVAADEIKETENEISELVRSAAIHALDQITFYLPSPNPKSFLREGKLQEIKDAAHSLGANLLVLNAELSPSQSGHIEDYLKMPVIDRTGLILEIFGRRASSKEGKLQVELAQLHYALPRIGGLGTVMSRLGGGIGSRGPGEQELERDRRKIRRRIEQVKTDLKRIEKHRSLLRSNRGKKGFMTVALVGYTNAGKSTLLNALTGSNALVEDKMFATLDPKTRRIENGKRKNYLFIDTVGLIRRLPHSLIESFHATLEEVSEADILIHVLDCSQANAKKFKATVEEVLEQIGASRIPALLALNKSDLASEDWKMEIEKLWPSGIMISAKNQEGLENLLLRLDEIAAKLKKWPEFNAKQS